MSLDEVKDQAASISGLVDSFQGAAVDPQKEPEAIDFASAAIKACADVQGYLAAWINEPQPLE